MTATQPSVTPHLVGRSGVMQQLYKMIGRICNADCAILLIGEKGSGKSAVARAIHDFSHRAAFPFQMISGRETRFGDDEELLGLDSSHEAEVEGTCYITDLTAMPYFLHERLLSIRKSGEFRCTHKNRMRKHRLRFVIADEGTINSELERGTMPSDFFFDWNFLPLFVPPLRDRKDDIPLLADHFLSALASELGITEKELAPEAMELLMAYNWPGNISQLREVLRAGLLQCKGNYIRVEHLSMLSRQDQKDSETLTRLEMFLSAGLSSYIDNYTESLGGDLYRMLLPQMEKSLFEYALKKSKGNKNRAAEILGLHRNTLLKKLQKSS